MAPLSKETMPVRLLRLAFGFLHISKQPEAAVAVVHNDVLPFYDRVGLKVGAILADNVL